MSDGDGENFLYGVMRGRDDPAGFSQDVALGIMDLGHDVRVMFTTRGGVRTGLVNSHPAPDGRECGGAITFLVPEAEGLPGPRWQVDSWDPLTVSPSLLCSCGWHGYIRGGRWVPV